MQCEIMLKCNARVVYFPHRLSLFNCRSCRQEHLSQLFSNVVSDFKKLKTCDEAWIYILLVSIKHRLLYFLLHNLVF